MNGGRGHWIWLTLATASCQGAPPPRAGESAPSAPPHIADSLVLTTRSGVEVWFTDARAAADTSGAACVERVLEIRREGRRIAVPLLYTGTVPRLVNDSTIEAPIWLHCRPGNVYQVSLTTGHPARVR